jgi:Flp pilus assembly protein TadD
MGQPGVAELMDQALADHQAGRLEAAEHVYRQVLAGWPEHADGLHLLGVVLHQRGNNAEAADLIYRAIGFNEASAPYRSNLGVVLCDLGRLEEAEGVLRAALRLGPDLPAAHYNLGNVLSAQGRLAQAEASYGEALRLQPVYADALVNLGHVLNQLGRPAEAERRLREALRLRPDSPEALNNLGVALAALGRPLEAAESYREAISLQFDFPDAHNNLAYALLAAGRFQEGWDEHEWRWRGKHMAAGARGFARPLWNGEPLAARTLLLHAEQGLGDTLQFCRYAPLIPAGGRVVLEAQKPLARLLSRLPGVDEIVIHGEALPPFDLQCPLLSLPRAFGTTLETIPARVPYLSPDATRLADWAERLANIAGLKVGLVWAGEPRKGWPELAAIDTRRSIALSTLAPLGDVEGVCFVSLQKGAPAAQTANPPPGLTLHDFTDELADFDDTAALVANLDLVISVDTSTAHLAGGLGKPVWLLNRHDSCWRWLLNRDDSPWYPTLRQFRQATAGDWDGVVRRVRDALKGIAGRT